MAPEPAALESHVMGDNMEDDPDADGEFEEDYETEPGQTPAAALTDAHDTEMEGSDADADADAEGEEVDEDDEGPIGPGRGHGVGAVKIQGRGMGISDSEDEDEKDGEAEVDEESSDAASDSDASSNSSGSESDAEGGWEAESNSTGAEVKSTEAADNNCTFCGQKEEDDPSEEYEEYLACAVCGDNAHRQCARDNDALQADEDTDHWRCKNCVEDGLEEDMKTSLSGRRDSLPKLARDLLVTQPGSGKKDAHSVFNTLIHPDDPMDGSRSLRKRKNSLEEEPPSSRTSRKRRKGSESGSPSPSRTPGQGSPDTVRRMRSIGGTDGAHDSGSEREASPHTRSVRPRRATVQQKLKPGANIVLSDGISLVVGIKVKNKGRLKKILSSRPKKKKSDRDRSRKILLPEEPEISHYPAIQTNYTPFFAFGDKDADEKNQKPYGGILSEVEADTSKTFPQAADRKKFEDARLRAEEDWKKKMAAIPVAPEPTRTPHKMSGPPSKIKCINFGGWEIDTWHAAPYPEEYTRNRVLYICEFCLKYMSSDYVAWRHKLKCPAKHPPGDEIYRDGRFSFFEVDGRKNPVYCQNLCLLAKLFLGSKTLYYDVEPFLFYVMTENNEFGCHFVGYFSKEKRPSSMNNVSCILVLPIHQRKGFGHMLIEFSYLLTRCEKKTGSPEKPLSDMGLVSYRSYWRLILCYLLINQQQPISIADISERTGMTADDIVSGLEALRALVRDPVTKTYALRLDHGYYKEYIDKFESKQWPKINPDALLWTPYVMGRTNLSHYDETPALHTVAQRDEDEEGNPDDDAAALKAQQQIAKENERDAAASASGAVTPYDSTSDTPLPNGNGINASVASIIPPTRFEIFPPVPGQVSTYKRRPGRPFGSRRRTTSTPLRRANSAIGSGGKNLLSLQPHSPNGSSAGGKPSPLGLGVNGTTAPIRGRRTRSKLGEVLLNGLGDDDDDNDEQDDDEAEKENNGGEAENGEDQDGLANGVNITPSRKQRFASNNGASRGGKGKGKGKGNGKEVFRNLEATVATAKTGGRAYEQADVVGGGEEEEEEEAEDADADADVDAEGEVDDIDAEGESDPDAEGEELDDEDAEGESIDEDVMMGGTAVLHA